MIGRIWRSDLAAALRVMALAWAILAAGAVPAVGAIGAIAAARPAVPQCAEDVAIVGTGAFHDGRWSAYACGPAVDDLRPIR
jgi:hypothetical protein